MHEIVQYFILTEIRYEIVNFRSRSDRGNFPRDLAQSTSRCMEQCMVADLSAGLGYVKPPLHYNNSCMHTAAAAVRTCIYSIS